MAKARKYASVMEEAHKPVKKRKAVLKGRDASGKTVNRKPRRYSLDSAKASAMRKAFRSTGDFSNPYLKAGAYQAFVQALADLGPNTIHPLKDVRAKMQSIMGKERWNAFKTPKNAKPDVGKDLTGRIKQNAEVLQRLTGNHPYGWKLAQMHACIDVLKDPNGKSDNPFYRLNTSFKNEQSVSPTNEFKKFRRGEKKADAKPKGKKTAPKAKAKAAPKPKAKPKAKAKAKGKKAAPKPKAKAKPKAKPKPKPKATAPKADPAPPTTPAPPAPEPTKPTEPTADEQRIAADLAKSLAGEGEG